MECSSDATTCPDSLRASNPSVARVATVWAAVPPLTSPSTTVERGRRGIGSARTRLITSLTVTMALASPKRGPVVLFRDAADHVAADHADRGVAQEPEGSPFHAHRRADRQALVLQEEAQSGQVAAAERAGRAEEQEIGAQGEPQALQQVWEGRQRRQTQRVVRDRRAHHPVGLHLGDVLGSVRKQGVQVSGQQDDTVASARRDGWRRRCPDRPARRSVKPNWLNRSCRNAARCCSPNVGAGISESMASSASRVWRSSKTCSRSDGSRPRMSSNGGRAAISR